MLHPADDLLLHGEVELRLHELGSKQPRGHDVGEDRHEHAGDLEHVLGGVVEVGRPRELRGEEGEDQGEDGHDGDQREDQDQGDLLLVLEAQHELTQSHSGGELSQTEAVHPAAQDESEEEDRGVEEHVVDDIESSVRQGGHGVEVDEEEGEVEEQADQEGAAVGHEPRDEVVHQRQHHRELHVEGPAVHHQRRAHRVGGALSGETDHRSGDHADQTEHSEAEELEVACVRGEVEEQVEDHGEGESQGGEEHDEVIPGVDGGLEGGALEPLEDASDRSEGDEEGEGEENRDRQGIR